MVEALCAPVTRVKLKRNRKRVGYVPEWSGVFEAWSRTWVARNGWRIAHSHTDEDALQECALIFVRCAQQYATAYGGPVDNPKWLMSLYKSAVANTFATMAVRDRQRREIHSSTSIDTLTEQALEGESTLYVMLSGASEELKQVLIVMSKAPSEFLNLMLKEGKDVVWSRRMLRLAGIANTNANIVGELRSLLSPEVN